VATVAASPNGKFEVLNVDHDAPLADGNNHELLLRHTESTPRARQLLSYARHVDVLWAPSSREVAVNDWGGSNFCRLILFRLSDSGVATRIDIGRAVDRTEQGRLLRKGDHRFIEAVRWTEERTLLIRIRAHGDKLKDEVLVWSTYDPSTGRIAAAAAP
jgi:hypothetical protein